MLHDSVWQMYVGSAFLGLGIGLAFSSLANLVVQSVPQEQTGIATAINMISRLVGGAIGAQVAAAILTAQTVSGGFPAESGYTAAFGVSAAAALLAWGAAFVVPRRIRTATVVAS